MPVFYDVAPSDVLRQTGSYGEAINLHINKRRYTDETIQNWKAALSKVGALRGWELKERGKGEFTEEVVRTLLIELKRTTWRSRLLEKQSRVWDHEQANDVLIAKGTKNIEALRLKFGHQSQRFFKKEELESLSNLRFPSSGL
ncbi:hypothetical protein NL676_019545 [Syzygium grande]|nr:hypothetical protein NL676_019545 [Syzygium grande]